MNLYTRLVSILLRALCGYALRRGRYVDYIHQGQLYMRRYAIAGWLTGDYREQKLAAFACDLNGVRMPARLWLAERWRWIRSRLPNLYVHQMINPDLDTCLHDHPWPWAVSWVALGGYREIRSRAQSPGTEREPMALEHVLYSAPALNMLSGSTFHRIANLSDPGHSAGARGALAPLGSHCSGGCLGTWTIFLAGPRARAKQWGYLVPGTGYVSHSERHAEFGGEEKRGAPVK